MENIHRRVLLILVATFLIFSPVFSQNTSPLVIKDFVVKSNEIIDLEQIPKFNRTDLDNNPICRIKVKSVGFEENVLQKFIFVPNGIEITHLEFKNGEWYLHVSSRRSGEITIKYKGDCVFRLPYQLEPGKVYELTLGMETATLTINTIPSDAEIYVDGKKVGTGYGSAAISLGIEHRYKVTCDNYIPEEDVVITEKIEKIQKQIELRPNFGYITIKSDPSGADVYVDEVKVGVTPYLSKQIQLGRRRVELKKKGYEPYAKVVTIKADEEDTLLANVKLVEDKTVPAQPVATTPVANNTSIPNNTNVSNYSSGHFSVSAIKKVQFSKGNLQYQSSTKTWRFAEHQWDMIGEANKNISSSYNGWIDLFGWGTGDDSTKSSTSNSDYSSYTDWSDETISNGDGKNWFTLTKDEWEYVFDNRSTSSGIRYAKAIVNGVNGVILLPDNWSSSNYSLSNTNKYNASFGSNSISQSDWTSIFESNGAVFLPAAGYRNGTNVYFGSIGSYWSATYKGNNGAYGVWFDDGRINSGGWNFRKYGESVRLVCPAE